jgi:uncharacterized protein (DUF58 family)
VSPRRRSRLRRRFDLFDRVGGTRLTGLGWGLVVVGAFVFSSPPPSADAETTAVLVGAASALVLIGLVVPVVLVRRITVEVRSPRDATVGDGGVPPGWVRGGGGGHTVRALDPTGPWVRTSSPGAGQVAHLADRRGLFQAVRVEVRVTAPLGVAAARRVHLVDLPYAVEVAPRPLAVTWHPAPAPVEAGPHPVARPALAGDLVRSVRPYVAGDPPHLVHWPTSARTGSLVVRELEPPRPVGQAVVVDLRGLGADTERAASYGLGAARAVLASGGELVLATYEAGGPVVARVSNPVDAGRRLARAVPGQPGVPPPGWPVVEIGA